mgnify:CR=1 FL=1
MAILHVTKISDETFAAGKSSAALSRKTLRDWVIGTLSLGAMPAAEKRESVKQEWSGDPPGTIRFYSEEAAKLDSALGQLVHPQELHEPRKVLAKEGSFAKKHDPKSCRLYGCWQCRRMGVKNPVRGL